MDMRVIVTVVSFVVFLLIVWWAYSGRQKQRFDEAANLPFADDEMQLRTVDNRQSAVSKVSTDSKSASQSAVRATAKEEEPRG